MTSALTIPAHIAAAGVAGRPVDFAWDESDTRQYYFGKTSDQLNAKIVPLSPRAQLALAAGITEWIIWRFDGMVDFPEARDYVEAAWAAVIDFRYCDDWLEPEGVDLSGPLLKPQWIAVYLLDDVVDVVRRKAPSSFEVGYIAFLAQHLFARHAAYKDWLRSTMARLAELSPLPEATREYYSTTRHTPEAIAAFDWGVRVPRAALDTTHEYDMAQAPADLDAYLRGLDPARNPFLVDSQTLLTEGFEGAPYTYPPR